MVDKDNRNQQEVYKKDHSYYKMKNNSDNRSLYISEDGHIFLETFGPYYNEISDFLVAIAEPVNRTKNIHEYSLTQYSLYAAASMNIKTSDIIRILSNLSKNELPENLIKYINDNTETYGKVKLILKNKRYFIECNDKDIIRKLMNIDKIYLSYQSIYQKRKSNKSTNITSSDMIINVSYDNKPHPTTELKSVIKNIMEDDKNEEKLEELASIGENFFEIDPEHLEDVKKICIDNLKILI